LIMGENRRMKNRIGYLNMEMLRLTAEVNRFQRETIKCIQFSSSSKR
jgi:hypothetical protein